PTRPVLAGTHHQKRRTRRWPRTRPPTSDTRHGPRSRPAGSARRRRRRRYHLRSIPDGPPQHSHPCRVDSAGGTTATRRAHVPGSLALRLCGRTPCHSRRRPGTRRPPHGRARPSACDQTELRAVLPTTMAHGQPRFWALTLSVIAAPIPEVGKLIAPSVAALHAKIPEQAQPLLACIQDPAQHELGIVAFRHVLATLLTRGRHTSTPVIGPWLAVVERASEHLTPSLAETLRPFTIFLTEPTSQLDPADQQLFGHVARRLLAYGLQQGYWLLTVNAINAVTATITTDAPATIALLRECITPGHLNALGYRTLSALAHKIPTLAATDPSFGRDTYIAAFAYRDTSTEGTSMGDSQILPMRSHRKQDYDGGLYQLVEHYPAFLAHSPTEAIDALLPVIDAYVQAEHRPDSAPDPVFLDG